MSRNIKEIGKELLGKSLNSYHRRTGLTQLEENNKMQDGILDGILSQVDDAYIEKTEQSNVIHLEGSGDGVVVLDSIEGNTMVNMVKSYNTNDFAYLNSIMQSDGYFKIQYGRDVNASYVRPKLGIHTYKPNTQYTVIVDIKENTCGKKLGMSAIHSAIETLSPRDFQNTLGISTSLITTRSDINIDDRGNPTRYDLYFGIWEEDGGDLSNHITFRYWILEGDWTNKELPPYFTGLQSSFEEKVNDEGKYEIEILSNNKNLYNVEDVNIDNWMNGGGVTVSKINNNIVFNGTVSNYFDFRTVQNSWNTNLTKLINKLPAGIVLTMSNNLTNEKNTINYWSVRRDGVIKYFTNTLTIQKGDTEIGGFVRFKNGTVLNNTILKVQIEINNKATNYTMSKQNKIKLLLNSPLLKGDKLVVKDGKLQHYHKMKQMKITDRSQLKYMGTYPTNEGYLCKHFNLLNTEPPKPYTDCYCDNISVLIPKGDGYSALSYTPSLAIAYQGMLYVTAKISDYAEPIDYLLAKTPTIVYELAEPYYEEVLNEYGEPVMLEGYENGTVYIDSVITPTTTLRYTPKMESLKTLKAVNHNNIMLTDDINNNIIDYMMNVDLMIMEKEMQITKTRRIGEKDMTNMQKRTFDMLKRLIKGKTLTEQECKDRVVLYLSAEKITSEQAEELMLYISEIYS